MVHGSIVPISIFSTTDNFFKNTGII